MVRVPFGFSSPLKACFTCFPLIYTDTIASEGGGCGPRLLALTGQLCVGRGAAAQPLGEWPECFLPSMGHDARPLGHNARSKNPSSFSLIFLLRYLQFGIGPIRLNTVTVHFGFDQRLFEPSELARDPLLQ
jgi:hypothetical protein